MKLSKKQLRKLVEAQLTVTPEDVAKAKDELGKKGGAAGPEEIAKVIDPDEEFDPEAVVTALMAADDDIKQSEKGDLVDMSTMVAENTLSRDTLRKLILQEMYHSRRDASFSRAQARYDAMTPDYDDREPYSAIDSMEDQFVFLYDRDRERLEDYAIEDGLLSISETDAPDNDPYTDYDIEDASGQPIGRVVHDQAQAGRGTMARYSDVIFDSEIGEEAYANALRQTFEKYYEAIFADAYDEMRAREDEEYYGSLREDAKRRLRSLIESTISEARYRGKNYRSKEVLDDMTYGDSGPTEFYKPPADPIRGPGNIYRDIRFKSSAREHALRQVNFIIEKFNLDRQIAFPILKEAMLTHGYMIDYDPSAMTITFENKSNTSDSYILDVSHLARQSI